MGSESDFRIYPPVTMADAILTSSSVPETTVTAWNSGSTYALGDQRGVAGASNSQDVYESLQGSNTNHAPASSPTWWKFLGTVYGTYSGGATYALGDIVTVIGANSHLLYKSTVGSNTGNPVTDTTKWLEVGYTNRWLAFDRTVQTQTVAPKQITMTITPGQLINLLTLLNVTAASVTVTQSISGYSKTKRLLTHPVKNWYDWYYERLRQVKEVVFDIPPYKTGVLTVTLDNHNDQVGIGCLFIGKGRFIGQTLWDFNGGILSYSTSKEEQGVITMNKRPNAKKLNFEVRIPEGYEDEAYRLLTEFTDVEIVLVGTSAYGMGLAYGFLGQWNVPVSNTGKAAPIEFRALT
ncbi:hypothetical protein GJ700_12740 [Duganella sp. FT92W]|uniref:Chitin-binding type-3 domain-containing protein n=1 Tax=Pseudoduganella rivuli TaxID=2666085 RepID=A0A7X2IMJ0_9BURK|nr:hypothetical protein [Pseudoduganella rivuli]MRV72575.1 hypothetical protein [Pseudoduganella rivuli]